jgi:hypothetical protein
VAAEVLLWLFGVVALEPLLILLGALLFYLSAARTRRQREKRHHPQSAFVSERRRSITTLPLGILDAISVVQKKAPP